MEKYRNLFISDYLNIWHEEFRLGMEASLGKCLMRKRWPGRSGSAVPRWQRGDQVLEVNRGGKKEKGRREGKKGQKLEPELRKPPRRCAWFRSTCAYTALSLRTPSQRVCVSFLWWELWKWARLSFWMDWLWNGGNLSRMGRWSLCWTQWKQEMETGVNKRMKLPSPPNFQNPGEGHKGCYSIFRFFFPDWTDLEASPASDSDRHPKTKEAQVITDNTGNRYCWTNVCQTES